MAEGKTNRVLLGEISRAHGVKGEVIIRSFCEPAEDIASFGPLLDKSGTRTFTVKLRGATAKGLIAIVNGVADRNTAEALRGTGLYVERDKLPEPDDGEFYHEDLVGLAVIDRDGKPLGTVVAVQNFGAGDLLEVRPEGAQKTEFYPFDGQFVPEVDLDTGMITVSIDPSEDDDGTQADHG